MDVICEALRHVVNIRLSLLIPHVHSKGVLLDFHIAGLSIFYVSFVSPRRYISLRLLELELCSN